MLVPRINPTKMPTINVTKISIVPKRPSLTTPNLQLYH